MAGRLVSVIAFVAAGSLVSGCWDDDDEVTVAETDTGVAEVTTEAPVAAVEDSAEVVVVEEPAEVAAVEPVEEEPPITANPAAIDADENVDTDSEATLVQIEPVEDAADTSADESEADVQIVDIGTDDATDTSEGGLVDYLTPETFDYEEVVAQVNASDLDAGQKEELIDRLREARENPDDLAILLTEMRTALGIDS
ncbi:hypothetical protein OCGS_0775 [Oceaniovalibus guishaninsula JLT2003]|uniref:Lipoprotein n=1 Tax=Oceaniovalibus guishaninsula JLT2003 TaxID=1231392 RepID=K2I7U1_9RHOB|nr:hypothetical protein [Oceaniovalibus guishaninsula]EKE45080.1 hypothetical protein OCGS_0775 [Oceaniovalibus guishaninsula JLT2003]